MAKKKQVHQGMEQLAVEIEAITEAVTDLTNKLDTVTRSVPPTAEGEGKDEQALVPLAGELRVLKRRLQDQTVRVKDLTDRCEL